MKTSRICCNTISYRKGYIEVLPNIHDGCINVETWSVDPDIDITSCDISNDDFFGEYSLTGNTELELSVDNAEKLIRMLQHAVKAVKKRG